MQNIVILTLIVAQLATGIHGVEVLVKIPEDQADAQMSRIIEAIANVTRQENEKTRKQEKRHWMELEGRLKGLERKIDELESEALRNKEINTSASMPEPKPSPKPKIYRGQVRMENNGTAGTTHPSPTSCSRGMCTTENAFKNIDGFFHSKKVDKWPVYIWMKFADPHRISQLGFRSVINNEFAPRRFDIVGSSNCADPWTVLHHVAESGFPNDTNDNVFKTWIVPQQNRQAFPCIGLKVEMIWNMDNPYVLLKNIQMWEEVAL